MNSNACACIGGPNCCLLRRDAKPLFDFGFGLLNRPITLPERQRWVVPSEMIPDLSWATPPLNEDK